MQYSQYSKLHFTRRSYKFKQLLFPLNRNQCTSNYFNAIRVLWSITAFIIFKSRWFETVDRFGQSELLPGSNFSYVPFYLFTGEVLYCLIVNTFFKRLPLCGYQLPFIRIYYYRLNFIRNSHVVLSHIQRSQSQRWINATFITQSLSSNCTIQESWGGIQ